jgi:hypothetical protein
MDERIALVRVRDGPAAALLGFMQKAAMEFRRDLVSCALSRHGIGQIDFGA